MSKFIHKDVVSKYTETAFDKMVIDGRYNFGKLAYAGFSTGNYYASLGINKLVNFNVAENVTKNAGRFLLSHYYCCKLQYL